MNKLVATLLIYMLHRLDQITLTQGNIMTTQAELAQALRDVNAQVVKTRQETLAKVAALEDAIKNAGGVVTDEVVTAFNDLKTTVQQFDDDTPDTPQTPPVPSP